MVKQRRDCQYTALEEYPAREDGIMASSPKTYWLNLFTGTTWKEFRAAGTTISGFRASRQKLAAKIQPGDVFLCYLTGVMLFGPVAHERSHGATAES